jgi:hypothetical protein
MSPNLPPGHLKAAPPPKLPPGLDLDKLADPKEAAKVADWVEKEYSDSPQPESVRMLVAILRKGSQISGQDGWFGPPRPDTTGSGWQSGTASPPMRRRSEGHYSTVAASLSTDSTEMAMGSSRRVTSTGRIGTPTSSNSAW